MNTRFEYRLAELVEKYLDNSTTSEEFAELEQLLAENPDARKQFLDLTYGHSQLKLLGESLVTQQIQRPVRSKFAQASIWLASLAALIVAVLFFTQQTESPIAKLVSSEDATWISTNPTVPGSQLMPGRMRLVTGLAIIEFRSGAEVVLEGPAELELESPMKSKLLAGSATIEVPESAIGFIMETPDSYAVDHGTQFSVNVGDNGKTSFEVLSGEISVHTMTQPEIRLTEKQAAIVDRQGVKTLDSLLPAETINQVSGVLRIRSQGRATSVIHNNDFTHLHPDYLMAKYDTKRLYERRSIVEFPLQGVDWSNVKSARLRLNLVPSGLGYTTRIPKVNRFAVYGLTDESKEDWKMHMQWDEAPRLSDAKLLGKFEVARTQLHGTVGIETDDLRMFLEADTSGAATLILVRETDELQMQGYVHSFASDSHPEVSGPLIELALKDSETTSTGNE